MINILGLFGSEDPHMPIEKYFKIKKYLFSLKKKKLSNIFEPKEK